MAPGIRPVAMTAAWFPIPVENLARDWRASATGWRAPWQYPIGEQLPRFARRRETAARHSRARFSTTRGCAKTDYKEGSCAAPPGVRARNARRLTTATGI